MFTEQKLKTYSELLNLTVAELDNFAKRYKNYLQSKDKITKNIIINGLFILEEIQTQKWLNEAEQIKYRTKNITILKYMDTIVELYKNKNMGTAKIVEYLQLNHRVKISKSSLDRFISNNNIKRVL